MTQSKNWGLGHEEPELDCAVCQAYFTQDCVNQ